ncbi:MAG: heavy metal translocating P-type ATPase, partial [Gammaproteobacteria bacterium]|nr:heavy metal translocating P-type ATPase [Gammaproteobacteria bacterium]
MNTPGNDFEPSPGGDAIELAVEGMSCASCVGRVERALQAVPGVAGASVNLATERATVHGEAAVGALLAAVQQAGYRARAVDAASRAGEDEAAARREAARVALGRDLLLALVLALPVFLLEMGAHLVPAVHEWIGQVVGTQRSRVIQFALTSLVLLVPGRRFYIDGIPALLRLAPDMNSLVAVGTLAVWGYLVIATFLPGLPPAGTDNVYYEAAAVIVALVLLGRYLEARARGRTSEAIQRLGGLQPKTARVLRDGRATDVASGDVVAGDLVEARPGERVPVDGEVLEGSSWVDESMLT